MKVIQYLAALWFVVCLLLVLAAFAGLIPFWIPVAVTLGPIVLIVVMFAILSVCTPMD